jgi:protein-tyrosine-phosphatase
MAEAFANKYGEGKVIASSAGVRLAEKVNAIVVKVMKEKGIDISSNKPKLLTPRMAQEADQVVTMGCSVEKICPAPLFKKAIDWNLEDPKGKPIEKIREIRDEIEKNVRTLLKETMLHDH